MLKINIFEEACGLCFILNYWVVKHWQRVVRPVKMIILTSQISHNLSSVNTKNAYVTQVFYALYTKNKYFDNCVCNLFSYMQLAIKKIQKIYPVLDGRSLTVRLLYVTKFSATPSPMPNTNVCSNFIDWIKEMYLV